MIETKEQVTTLVYLCLLMAIYSFEYTSWFSCNPTTKMEEERYILHTHVHARSIGRKEIKIIHLLNATKLFYCI